MTDNLNDVLPTFTPEEKAYFDNRGGTPDKEPEREEQEVIDVVEDVDDEIDMEADAPDEADQEPEQKPKKQVVPIQALHREREARKAADERFRQMELDSARLQERMTVLLRQMQPEPEQEQQYNLEDDPIGGIRQNMTRTEQVEQRLAQFEQAERQRAEFAQMSEFTQYHEQEFLKTKPDYYEAVNHLRNARVTELQLVGVPQNEIGQIIMEEAKSITIAAARSGKSPAEIAYTIAQQRGYAPKQAAAPVEAKPSTKSLSQASGSAAGASITAQDLLRMSPQEFETYASKNPKKMRQLMGA